MEGDLKKNLINMVIFVILVNLPFISISQVIGMDMFFDSFENPKYYQYLKTEIIDNLSNKYFILQKSSHPDFSIDNGDTIIFIEEDGTLKCESILNIENKKSDNYYKIIFNGCLENRSLNDYQILGKIIKNFEDNIWNKISLQLWDSSINDLNVVALFAHN